MKISLDKEQMRREWLVRRHRVAPRGDVTLMIGGGTDLSMIADREMRDWYVELLSVAPAELLKVVDIASEVEMSVDDDGVGRVVLPASVVRVTGVECDGWLRPATVVCDMMSPLGELQRGEYSRGGGYCPVVLHDGDRLWLYSFEMLPGSSPSVTRLLCVLDRGEDVYEMDERALGLIKPV